ncbi:MAG: hypothetical protein MUO23_02190 [Anaerolineales bacterium]|nr:hypothetical protein [Anaerolineales bacterium]
MKHRPPIEPLVRALLALILALGLLAGTAGSAGAQEIVYGSTVPAGTTVDQDIILSGEEVSIDGTVLGDVIALGGRVRVNGRVEGTLITIAQDVELNGQVGGSMMVAALQLLSGPGASIGKNLYFGGLSLVLPPGATVGRDMLAATMGATLGGEVGRDVRAIIGPFEFARLIIGAAEQGDWLGKTQAWWESVRPQPAPQPLPTVPPPASSSGGGGLMRVRQAPVLQVIPKPVVIPLTEAMAIAPVATKAPSAVVSGESVLAWLQGRLLVFLPLAFYGLIALWLFPPSITASADRLRRKPWPTALWGFLVFVVANQLFAVAAILTLLVVVIGLAVGLQSMWGFAFSIWALGLPAIGLCVGLLAVSLYGLSVIVASYAALSRALDPGKQYLRRAGVMLLAALAFVLLTGIPVLGTLVWVVAFAVGSGAMFFAYTDWRAARRGPPLAAPAELVSSPPPTIEPLAAAPAAPAAAPVTELQPPPAGAAKPPAGKAARSAPKGKPRR